MGHYASRLCRADNDEDNDEEYEEQGDTSANVRKSQGGLQDEKQDNPIAETFCDTQEAIAKITKLLRQISTEQKECQAPMTAKKGKGVRRKKSHTSS